MSGRPNNRPVGEQDKRDEESLVAPVVCDEEARDRRSQQTAAAQSNGSHPHRLDPALIGLVRLLARQAAREKFDARVRPELAGGEFE